MQPTTREFAVDKAAMTVTHIPSGIVFRFWAHPIGGWIGAPTEKTKNTAILSVKKSQELAAIASRAGDAWEAAQKSD
jgi:hypothetical protein